MTSSSFHHDITIISSSNHHLFIMKSHHCIMKSPSFHYEIAIISTWHYHHCIVTLPSCSWHYHNFIFKFHFKVSWPYSHDCYIVMSHSGNFCYHGIVNKIVQTPSQQHIITIITWYIVSSLSSLHKKIFEPLADRQILLANCIVY